MFIVTCFLAQTGYWNFLPQHCNTIIKEQLCGEELLSMLPLLQVDVFKRSRLYCSKSNYAYQTSQKEACIRPCDTNNFTQNLHECTTILQLKVYIAYVVRKLVGHSPYLECPVNSVFFIFSICLQCKIF